MDPVACYAVLLMVMVMVILIRIRNLMTKEYDVYVRSSQARACSLIGTECNVQVRVYTEDTWGRGLTEREMGLLVNPCSRFRLFLLSLFLSLSFS